ncbi:MAG TPA: CotH kinase family protein [Kofleriaceae bacterium]|nr:CotH kinase family protein [Kofleriaceae bacterium]
MTSGLAAMLAFAGAALAAGVAACGGNLDVGLPDAGPDAAVDAAPDARPPPRELTGPARVAITCPGPIPVDGKADCTIVIAWPEGDVVYDGPAGIGLHGRSSLNFPKHQYAIELRGPDGTDRDVDLFGMGADADWLLNGAWLDRSLLRNKLGYDLDRAMGGDAPDSRFAEVTLDGAPLGVFLLCERLERGRERIDMPRDDGTGKSFIVMGSETGIPSMVQAKSWEVVYPTPAPAGVATRLAAVEQAVLGRTDAMFDELDLASLVDFVILEEAIKNNDAYYLSQHLYTAYDGKLHAIPWDLDLSWGQPSYNHNELSDGWLLYRSTLIAAPAAQPIFHDALVARWTALRHGVLATDAVLARIEGYRRLLGPAIARNWSVWDITQPQSTPGFPLYPVTSADDEYVHLEEFVTARLAWIDASIASY